MLVWSTECLETSARLVLFEGLSKYTRRSSFNDLQSCSGNVGTSSLGNYPSALRVKEPRSRHGEEGKIISCRLRHYFGDGVGVCHIYRAAAHMPFPLPFHCLSMSGYQAVAQFL